MERPPLDHGVEWLTIDQDFDLLDIAELAGGLFDLCEVTWTVARGAQLDVARQLDPCPSAFDRHVGKLQTRGVQRMERAARPINLSAAGEEGVQSFPQGRVFARERDFDPERFATTAVRRQGGGRDLGGNGDQNNLGAIKPLIARGATEPEARPDPARDGYDCRERKRRESDDAVRPTPPRATIPAASQRSDSRSKI